ncbi:alpha/beta-hydrolase [Cryphonectria parasitica EP155]|uniref:Carboxylic ester hydrolase n=1 Tax=Cryphonectria parasitica (strain ATCC 38755 / EP155) TaxID=660469 RepID=A0A9P5CLC5_CRYP1|nr:alpha/beta-hydrolase [Cryphonectria parasitica EP155]KAF3763189.1 alpha/beta-hydrolase [Cryphonectria parasitica EP155]
MSLLASPHPRGYQYEDVLNVASSNLTVTTRTGTFVGDLNDTFPDVRQFKYIPYAKPPTGSRRWAPPSPLDSSSEIIDSTVFGPACAQYVSAIPTAWALNITGNLVVNYGESLLAGQLAQNSAEDCLSLAIWTPANATAESRLPVLHFLTGGGDVTGGVNIPTQLPPSLVSRSQEAGGMIVVTTNYRVNVFSFPNAKGLENSTNFGLQDQRLAVEWVYENIGAFGGDPSKITLWGQSAGASAADMYLFAYPDNPLVRASISSSGFTIGHALNSDYSGSNFSFVAKNLGCDFDDAQTELECMRHVPYPRIENFIGNYQDNSTLVNTSQPAISFTRRPDDKFVLSDYPAAYAANRIAPLPKLIGTTAREASALVAYPIHNYTAGPSEQAITTATLSTVCGAHNTSVFRNNLYQNGTGLSPNLKTWRYQWAGNFSNIDGGVPWLGAYHYSDLYMLFGTWPIAPGEVSQFEVETCQKMQDLLVAFVKDPDNGLSDLGWPTYETSDEDGGTAARFGADGQVLQYEPPKGPLSQYIQHA